MKTFEVFKKSNPDEVIATCDCPEDASEEIIDAALENGDVVFDYDVRVIEEKEPGDTIKSYEQACEFLGRNPRISIQCDGNVRALEAWHKLLTIAEAWNKIDGFVPDWGNSSQWKYYPWFYYNKNSAGFVFASTSNAPSGTLAHFGSLPCFKSSYRARQFGEMFVELYDIAIRL